MKMTKSDVAKSIFNYQPKLKVVRHEIDLIKGNKYRSHPIIGLEDTVHKIMKNRKLKTIRVHDGTKFYNVTVRVLNKKYYLHKWFMIRTIGPVYVKYVYADRVKVLLPDGRVKDTTADILDRLPLRYLFI